MALDNQKLFSQMADLGRNINLLSDSVKKNTAAVESMSAEPDKEGDKKISDTLNSLDKTLKDIQKVLSAPKPKEMIQPAAEQKPAGNQQDTKQKEKSDFSKIAGGIAKSVVRAFQEGGVTPKKGNYLVGENGPEIVALPKGSGVIPLDIKDLMAGISKVPELSEFIKENSKVSIYGEKSGSDSGIIITEDGKRINLNKLDKTYQDKFDELESSKGDPKLLESLGEKINAILDIQDKSQKVVNNSINNLENERSQIFNKIADQSYTDEDNRYLNSVWDAILEKSDKSDVNEYTISKAHLMATQMLLEKKSKETSIKEDFDKIGKTEDKTAGVVNPKIAEIKKEAEKAKSEEKSGGLFSKIGLKKREKPEKEEAEETGEKKASAILGKAGKFAENVAFGVAGKVIGSNLPGVGGALAQKGLGALKKFADKGLAPKEKSTKEGSGPSEMKEAKSSLAKSEISSKETPIAPTLKNEVKKLSPPIKPAETKKDQAEQPKESKPAQQPLPSKESEAKTDSQSKTTKTKTESSGESSPLGTSKDLDDIKGALSRIASILEGTLTVSPLDSPFRPDSRRL